MKRCSTVALGVLMLIGMASAALAIYPVPDMVASFQMQQGWYNGQLVWFICTDTNDINFAQSYDLTLAPKLSSAIGSGAADVYIVRNPASTQGPIFTAVPGALPYSGIWQVTYVDWQPGFPKVSITSEAQIVALVGSGAVTVTPTSAVVDCPIMAVGPLGGPWYPAPAGRYRIPQAFVRWNYTYTKEICLPAYCVFCQDPITRRVTRTDVIVPDAETTALADLLRANYAPGLASIPFSDTMRFWVILNSPQNCQLPVIEACPTNLALNNFVNADSAPISRGCGGRLNTNYVYSPVQRLTLLNRVSVGQSAVINNPPYIEDLLLNGALSVDSESDHINAPVVLLRKMVVTQR